MPKRGQSPPISEVERLRYNARWEQMKEADPDLTYESFGARIGLRKSSVSNILSGKVKRSAKKHEFAAALGLNEDLLLKEIVQVIEKLDVSRLQRLHERALVLLEEQQEH